MKTAIFAGLACLMFSSLTLAELPVTEKRQQLFEQIEEQSETLDDLLSDEQWQHAAPLADRIAEQVAELNNLFPEDSKGDGRARDGVWEEWPEFARRLQRFEQNYRDVSTSINTGAYSRAEQAFDDADSSCRSCHMSYRSIW